MSALNTLKFANAKAPASVRAAGDELRGARDRLIERLGEQIKLAEGLVSGKAVQITRVQRVPKPDGQGTEKKNVVANVAPWFWHNIEGVWFVELRHNKKQLAITAEAPVVEAGKDKGAVVNVLNTLMEAVKSGELDDVLRKASKVGATK